MKTKSLYYGYFEAVVIGDLDMTRRLIAKGANVDVSPNGLPTPLLYAVFNKFYDIMELLINHGADINKSPLNPPSYISSKVTPFNG